MDVKTACLGVLALSDASGYEIRKAFEEGPFSHFAEGAFGSIYPALKQLEGDGSIVVRGTNNGERPGKKIYRITPRGKLVLLDSLAQPPAPDRYKSDFLFHLMFAEFQSAASIEAMVEDRIALYRAMLAAMQDCSGSGCHGSLTNSHAFVHGFGLAVYRAALDYLEDHKHEIVAVSLQAHHDAAD